jgi:hypothetical protein
VATPAIGGAGPIPSAEHAQTGVLERKVEGLQETRRVSTPAQCQWAEPRPRASSRGPPAPAAAPSPTYPSSRAACAPTASPGDRPAPSPHGHPSHWQMKADEHLVRNTHEVLAHAGRARLFGRGRRPRLGLHRHTAGSGYTGCSAQYSPPHGGARRGRSTIISLQRALGAYAVGGAMLSRTCPGATELCYRRGGARHGHGLRADLYYRSTARPQTCPGATESVYPASPAAPPQSAASATTPASARRRACARAGDATPVCHIGGKAPLGQQGRAPRCVLEFQRTARLSFNHPRCAALRVPSTFGGVLRGAALPTVATTPHAPCRV